MTTIYARGAVPLGATTASQAPADGRPSVSAYFHLAQIMPSAARAMRVKAKNSFERPPRPVAVMGKKEMRPSVANWDLVSMLSSKARPSKWQVEALANDLPKNSSGDGRQIRILLPKDPAAASKIYTQIQANIQYLSAKGVKLPVKVLGGFDAISDPAKQKLLDMEFQAQKNGARIAKGMARLNRNSAAIESWKEVLEKDLRVDYKDLPKRLRRHLNRHYGHTVRDWHTLPAEQLHALVRGTLTGMKVFVEASASPQLKPLADALTTAVTDLQPRQQVGGKPIGAGPDWYRQQGAHMAQVCIAGGGARVNSIAEAFRQMDQRNPAQMRALFESFGLPPGVMAADEERAALAGLLGGLRPVSDRVPGLTDFIDARLTSQNPAQSNTQQPSPAVQATSPSGPERVGAAVMRQPPNDLPPPLPQRAIALGLPSFDQLKVPFQPLPRTELATYAEQGRQLGMAAGNTSRTNAIGWLSAIPVNQLPHAIPEEMARSLSREGGINWFALTHQPDAQFAVLEGIVRGMLDVPACTGEQRTKLAQIQQNLGQAKANVLGSTPSVPLTTSAATPPSARTSAGSLNGWHVGKTSDTQLQVTAQSLEDWKKSARVFATEVLKDHEAQATLSQILRAGAVYRETDQAIPTALADLMWNRLGVKWSQLENSPLTQTTFLAQFLWEMQIKSAPGQLHTDLQKALKALDKLANRLATDAQ